MCVASRALKSLVHFDSALRIAVSASPAGCADTAVAAAISKNPHQAERSFTRSDLSGRLLQDIGDGGTPYNTGKIAGDPGMTRTCDLRFRKQNPWVARGFSSCYILSTSFEFISTYGVQGAT